MFNILISILISVLLFYIISLFWNDEVRFFGRKTATEKAVITNTKFKQRGRSGYYQKVSYKFIYNEKVYETYFWANKFIGEQFVGDSINVKFQVSDPTNSKYISTELKN